MKRAIFLAIVAITAGDGAPPYIPASAGGCPVPRKELPVPQVRCRGRRPAARLAGAVTPPGAAALVRSRSADKPSRSADAR